MQDFIEYNAQAVVIGAGHAGVEADISSKKYVNRSEVTESVIIVLFG